MELARSGSVFSILGTTPEAWEQASRSGAIAGRGYHFQNAALTWLAVLGIAGRWPVQTVIPEGRDDGTLSVQNEAVDVQIKSRQAHRGAVSASTLAGWLAALADRRSSVDPAARLLLIVERGVPETGLTLVARDVAAVRGFVQQSLAELRSPERAQDLLARVFIVALPQPLVAASVALADERGLPLAVARLAVQRVAGALAQCQDLNAERSRLPAALTLTDAQNLIDRVVELVDYDALEDALRAGICEAVDFSKPDRDERYLLGVATTPAHVAAGVVIDRPALVSELSDALDAQRRLLITGPSGSGKSAAAWLTVHATRHRIRWYRVRTLRPSGAVAAIDRLARALEPSVSAPVGFVVDDVGRVGSAAWDALIDELAHRPGVVALGTTRELDLADLRRLTDVGVRRVGLDDALAEELWQQLSDRGDTDWVGWREPAAAAHGLVLEYNALLAGGERLEAVIGAQLRALAADGADDELLVLGAVAVADILGTTLTVIQAASVARLSESRTRGAARRLRREFLVRVEGATLRGLHELRSRVSAYVVHDVTHRALDDTVEAVLNALDSSALVHAIPRAADEIDAVRTVEMLRRRVQATRSSSDLVAALEGLRTTEYRSSAADCATRIAAAIPSGDISDVIKSRFGQNIHDSILLRLDAPDWVGEPTNALRSSLIRGLNAEVVIELHGIDDAHALAGVLLGAHSVAPASWLGAVVGGVAGHISGSLDGAAVLLDVARLLGPDIHQQIVEALGGVAVTAAAVAAWRDFDFDIPDASEREPHAYVRVGREQPFWRIRSRAHLVQNLLAAIPHADRVAVIAVDDTGRDIPELYPGSPDRDAVLAQPMAEHDLGRRWRGAVKAAVGVPRWSGRLADELHLLRRLERALRSYADCLCVARTAPRGVLLMFQTLDTEAQQLAPAPGEGWLGEADSAAPVGAANEDDPVIALLRDPGRFIVGEKAAPGSATATAYRLWRVSCDLRDSGRWSLLSDREDDSIRRIADLLYAIRTLRAEQRAVDAATWSRMGARARLASHGRLQLAVEHAHKQADTRLARQGERVGRALSARGVAAEVELVGTEEDWPATVWPPGTVVITVQLESAAAWPAAIADVMDCRRTLIEAQRHVVVLASIRGAVSACLSGEAALAWWPRIAASATVGREARPEPRGLAWHRAVVVAAKLRVARRFLGALELSGRRTAMAELAVAAIDQIETEGAKARAALVVFGLTDAASTFDTLTLAAGPDELLRARVDKVALSAADLDAQVDHAGS